MLRWSPHDISNVIYVVVRPSLDICFIFHVFILDSQPHVFVLVYANDRDELAVDY